MIKESKKRLVVILTVLFFCLGTAYFVGAQTGVSASITCNGVSDVCNVLVSNPVSISWSCVGSTSGSVSNDRDNTVWSGTNGSQNLGGLVDDTIFFLTCNGTNETATSNVLVNVVSSNPTDITPPGVVFLDITFPSASLTRVAWEVTDSGGSFLDRISVDHALFNSASCNDTNRSGCIWMTAAFVNAIPNSNDWGSAIYDSLIVPGQYIYRIRVFDNAGNMTVYPVPPGTCNYSPSGDTVNLSQRIRQTYVYGVSGATSVVDFAVWSEANPGLVVYSGINQGGGTWRGDVILVDHPLPSFTHVGIYLDGYPNGTSCGTSSFTLAAPALSPPALPPPPPPPLLPPPPPPPPCPPLSPPSCAGATSIYGANSCVIGYQCSPPPPPPPPPPPLPPPPISPPSQPAPAAQSFDFLFEIPNPFSGGISTFDDLINAVILFLYYIAGPIIVAMIVLAGLFFLFGRGEPSKVETGKKILLYAIIGLIIILIGRGFIVLLHSIIDLGV